jgi:hypothetical protein
MQESNNNTSSTSDDKGVRIKQEEAPASTASVHTSESTAAYSHARRVAVKLAAVIVQHLMQGVGEAERPAAWWPTVADIVGALTPEIFEKGVPERLDGQRHH